MVSDASCGTAEGSMPLRSAPTWQRTVQCMQGCTHLFAGARRGSLGIQRLILVGLACCLWRIRLLHSQQRSNQRRISAECNKTTGQCNVKDFCPSLKLDPRVQVRCLLYPGHASADMTRLSCVTPPGRSHFNFNVTQSISSYILWLQPSTEAVLKTNLFVYTLIAISLCRSS